MTSQPAILCNGEALVHLPVDDRGAALGDGLFETILVRRGQCIWLDEHLMRLAGGCTRLGLDFPRSELERDIAALLGNSPAADYAVLRISLSRKSAGFRGYAPATGDSNRLLQLAGIPAPNHDHWRSGIRSYLCKTRLPEGAATAGIKHNNRLAHVMARAERPVTDFPEGLMLSHNGLVIEGVSSNVFLVVDSTLVTPALDTAGVVGVVRQKILAQAQSLGMPQVVRRVELPELYRAQEMFFCNSLTGIWPVRALDCLRFSSFELTRKLQSQLEAVWYA